MKIYLKILCSVILLSWLINSCTVKDPEDVVIEAKEVTILPDSVDDERHINPEIFYQKINFEGHTYIVFDIGTTRAGVVHDANCVCRRHLLQDDPL